MIGRATALYPVGCGADVIEIFRSSRQARKGNNVILDVEPGPGDRRASGRLGQGAGYRAVFDLAIVPGIQVGTPDNRYGGGGDKLQVRLPHYSGGGWHNSAHQHN